MYFKEIYKQNWFIDPNLVLDYNKLSTLPLLEQECLINVMRCGLKDETKSEIIVSCSNQVMITELSKSEYFEVQKLLLSKSERNNDFILEVEGILKTKGLTIRKKIPVFSKEEKKRRSDRMKRNFDKK